MRPWKVGQRGGRAGSDGNGGGDGAVQKTCCVEERAAGRVGGRLTGDGDDVEERGVVRATDSLPTVLALANLPYING